MRKWLIKALRAMADRMEPPVGIDVHYQSFDCSGEVDKDERLTVPVVRSVLDDEPAIELQVWQDQYFTMKKSQLRKALRIVE